MNELKSNLSGPSLKLNILAGPCTGVAHLRPGDKEVVIGRHSQCSLSLPQDIKVSRFHCRVYEKNGRFVLEDLKSSNGTFFQEQMITQPVEIKPGDRFQVGETYIEVLPGQQDNTPSINIEPIPFNQYEMKLPSLEPVEESNTEDSSLKYSAMDAADGAMETVIGVSLNNIWAEVAKFKPTVPASMSPTIRVSAHDLNKASNFESVTRLPSITTKLSPQELMCIQAVIPNFTHREQFRLMDPKIAGRYQCEQKLGEAKSWAMLYCKERDETVFVQYTKERLTIPTLPYCHPNLLLPSSQGEFLGKNYRVFSKVGTPIPPEVKFLSEIKSLEIAITVCDIMLSLHEVNIFGFDLHRSSIFFKENEVPYIALFPAKVYDNLSGEEADIYSLGLFLWELIVGVPMPYTPIGTLDNDKFLELARKISVDILALLTNIFKRQESSLEKIMGQLQVLLHKKIAPKMGARQPTHVQISCLEGNLIYFIDNNVVAKIPWKPSENILFRSISPNSSEDELKEIGYKIYQALYPTKLRDAIETSNRDLIVLSLDDKLLDYAWEFAYDGQQFLAQKYFYSRKPFSLIPETRSMQMSTPRMMILTQNQPQCLQKQQELVEMLQTNYPKLEIKVYSTQDNPFDIVQNIARTDILHVIASGQYFSEKPMQSGWALEGKYFLKLRFFEIAPRLPKLVFCQMPINVSAAKFMSNLYSLGVPHIIGTTWPNPNFEAISTFYQYLFQGLSPEIALGQTKKNFQEYLKSIFPLLSFGHSKQAIIYANND